MAIITISVKGTAGEAAIGFDVNERQAKDLIADIQTCEHLLMNYEVSSKIAAAIKHLVDPRVIKWSEMQPKKVSGVG